MITTILLITLCSLDANTCETFDSETWLSQDSQELQIDIGHCVELSNQVASDDYFTVESTECFSISEREV